MHVANHFFLLKQTAIDPWVDQPDGTEMTEGIMTI